MSFGFSAPSTPAKIQVFRDTGLPLVAQGTEEFEQTLRYRRFLDKEERDLTAQLQKLQTEAAIRDLGNDFSGFEQHSILVSIRPLVELHNLRCSALSWAVLIGRRCPLAVNTRAPI